MYKQGLSMIKNLLFRWSSVFTILFIFSFPFPHNIFIDLGMVLNTPFVWLSGWFGDNVLQINYTYTKQFDSDSIGLYIHILLLFFISFFIGLGTLFIKIKPAYLKISKNIFLVFVSYYLGSVLLMYGFDKIFKHQFYLPEPNILYTPIGDLSKDIAFWSVMGASRSYSVFSGIIEVIPALLLFFNRTRLLGAVISFMVLINVVMLNFGFDISVKVFSLFLLFLSLVLIAPNSKYLLDIFWKHKLAEIPKMEFKRNYFILNIFLVLAILVDSLYPYVVSRNFNDDNAARPIFHGVYEINKAELTENSRSKPVLDKVFIHRQGYLIFQLTNNKLIDYKMYTDTIRKELTLVDYNKKGYVLSYKEQNKKLTELKGNLDFGYLNIQISSLLWENKPLIRPSFSWTID